MSKLLCAFLLLPTALRAQATSKIPHGTVEFVSVTRSLQPGVTSPLGLLFHLEPGWHIYWKNPGDSGQPPRLTWNLPAGLTAGDIAWPTPKRLPVGPLLDYGYEGAVLLPIPVTAAPDFASATATIHLNLRVLVCRETCMPGKAALTLSLPVKKSAPAPNPSLAALFQTARTNRPEPPPSDWKFSATQNAGSLLLTLNGLPANAPVSFIPARPNVIQNSAPQLQLPATHGAQTLELKRPENAAAPATELAGLLLVDTKAYEISAPLTSPPTPATPARPASPVPAKAQPTFAFALLLAFGGGLILNLMPCVFPVLSIKVLSLLDHFAGDRKTVRLSALVYTFGVLVSFWILVAVLLSLRAAGRNLGWGFQLQSPGFVAFLICLLFVFALSLIGVFEIGASVMNTGSSLTQRGTYTGSFFTGVLATIVATPCTAPLMGVAVGFALSQGAAISVLIFSSMALGLAAPFLLLSLFPQLSRFLPRPGAWMETMKQILAFPLFATVIWLLWVLGQQVGIDQLTLLLFALLVLAIAAWIAGRWPFNRAARLTAAALGLVAAVYSASVLQPVAHAMQETTQGLKWEAFTPEKLAAYRASGKPVLIDFTAAWCLTCQVNDRVVFHSPDVEKHLNRSNIALLRADWTSYDPAITATLANYGRSGIPLYVVYGPDPNAPATTLPDGLLSPAGFLNQLHQLNL